MTLGYVQDSGIQDWLTDLKAGTNFTGMLCHLYQSVIAWSDTTTFATANAAESTFSGYASQTATGWGTVGVSSHVASTVATTLTYTLSSGSQNVYGAYLTNSANNKLYAGQADPNAPVGLNTTVSVYQVSITVTMQSVN